MRAAAVEARREMAEQDSGVYSWQGRVMKGELDEGRRRGEERRRRETKADRDGNCFDATRRREERGGEVRVSAKKETDLGVHIMQVRTVLCGVVCMAWHGRDGMAVAVGHPSRRYTVLHYAPM